MTKMKTSISNFSFRLTLALFMIVLWVSPLIAHSVQAGSGGTVDIPFSTIVPIMDGVCDPTEYADAAQVIIPVGPSLTFPVYMKHTVDDAYFCFGDESGLPQPDGGQPSVTIYIDRNNDGAISGNNGDDFGIWMPYGPGSPWSFSWNAAPNYNGADPGGWQAVKHQLDGPPIWQVEYKISSQTMGGWKHSVGLALFYHWWRFSSDDFSWPANGIWASPANWGNAYLSMPKADIDNSTVIPTVDGQCNNPEYSDASTIPFAVPGGSAAAYLKHSLTDLYVCLKDLAPPDVSLQNSPNAALLIDTANTGGSAPAATHISLTISYNGAVVAGIGDGVGFSGPLLGDYQVIASPTAGGWDAEFRLSSAVVGNWRARSIGLSVAEMNVLQTSDYFGWPAGSTNLVPYTWGDGNLINLGHMLFLPAITR